MSIIFYCHSIIQCSSVDDYAELIVAHCEKDILKNCYLANYNKSKYNWKYNSKIFADSEEIGLFDFKFFKSNKEKLDEIYFSDTDNYIFSNYVVIGTYYGTDCNVFSSSEHGKINGIKIIMDESSLID